MNTTKTQTFDWECITPQAAWQARDSQSKTIFNNRMWIFGGWFSPEVPNPRDVWSSEDGVTWTQAVETAPWEFSDGSVALTFNDRLWLMGGRKVPGGTTSNEVWSSADGAQWQLETQHAGWSSRCYAGHVIFQDKMWVMGGVEDFYINNDDTLHHDVWCSKDGKSWTCVTENAGWAKRAYHQSVVFDGKMWVIGGGGSAERDVARNDVWCSEDGQHWTQVTASAAWGPRFWPSVEVYRDCLWVLGGWQPGNGNLDDVWYSRDGQQWTQLLSETKWTPRHAQAAFVHQDRLLITGGHAEPVVSEVWSLALPEHFGKTF